MCIYIVVKPRAKLSRLQLEVTYIQLIGFCASLISKKIKNEKITEIERYMYVSICIS